MLQEVVRADREVIGRLRNCILALAASKMLLYDSSIMYSFEESMKYSVSPLKSNYTTRIHLSFNCTVAGLENFPLQEMVVASM